MNRAAHSGGPTTRAAQRLMVASLAGGPPTWAAMARRPALLVATSRAGCTALGLGLSARRWLAVLCGTGPSRAAPPPPWRSISRAAIDRVARILARHRLGSRRTWRPWLWSPAPWAPRPRGRSMSWHPITLAAMEAGCPPLASHDLASLAHLASHDLASLHLGHHLTGRRWLAANIAACTSVRLVAAAARQRPWPAMGRSAIAWFARGRPA
jgi:hypothetical protein